jgi:hypothetical protein
VVKHLEVTKFEIREDIASLDRTDQHMANGIAERLLTRRLGKRLHRPTFEAAIRDINNFVARTSPPPRSNLDSGPPIRLQNRFEGLTIEAGEQINEDDGLHQNHDDINAPSSKKSRPTAEVLQPIVTERLTMKLRPNKTVSFNPPIVSMMTTAELESTSTTSAAVDHSPETTGLPTKNSGRASISGHRYAAKDTWRLTKPANHHRIQVIGDQNVSTWTEVALPPEFNVDAFSGASLVDILAVLERSTSALDTIDTIVVAPGLKDMDNHPDQILGSILELAAWFDKHKKRISFVSLSIIESLSEAQKETINLINRIALDTFLDNYITACRREQVTITTNQFGGILYSKNTAEVIVCNIVASLNWF